MPYTRRGPHIIDTSDTAVATSRASNVPIVKYVSYSPTNGVVMAMCFSRFDHGSKGSFSKAPCMSRKAHRCIDLSTLVLFHSVCVE